MEGLCSSGGGTFTCLTASATIANAQINGTYSTADNRSGSFTMTKACH
jgi:hypothetical protein